jgi:excisionase family DNA binding protein
MATRQRTKLVGETFIAIDCIASCCMVSRSTVWRWIKDDRLPAIKLPSGHYRVILRDFKDFLDRYNLPVPKELSDIILNLPKPA